MGARERRAQDKLDKINQLIPRFLPNYPRADVGFDPIVELGLIAANPGTPLEYKIPALKELAGYMYPKMRSIEVAVDGKIDHNHRVMVVSFKDIDVNDPEQLARYEQRTLPGQLAKEIDNEHEDE